MINDDYEDNEMSFNDSSLESITDYLFYNNKHNNFKMYLMIK